jgi:hypothetical protein
VALNATLAALLCREALRSGRTVGWDELAG